MHKPDAPALHAASRRCPNCNGGGKVSHSMTRNPQVCGRCDGRGTILDPREMTPFEIAWSVVMHDRHADATNDWRSVGIARRHLEALLDEHRRYREALLLLTETGDGGYVVLAPEEDETVKATLREVNRGCD